MKKTNYQVELEDGVWLAPWDGDPGRTLNRDFADLFYTVKDAEAAIDKAREYRPFKMARLQSVMG